jgi:hypothetical protein
MLDEADGGEALTASHDTGCRLVIPAPAGVPARFPPPRAGLMPIWPTLTM